jgi:pantoate--beta-alanine ligase
MQIIETPQAMQAYAREARARGRTIGLVPTMGYLHDGHLSLMRASAADNDITITSLFVNPTQFGTNEDLDKYPRDVERDCRLAEQAGVDVMFTPANDMMYPEGYRTYVRVKDWSDLLCGVTRPVHFRGVTTVCCKLFHLCKPNRAYFGLKDAQQCLIIKKMVADLNMDLEIVPMPLVREADGLAMSSRNVYLTDEQRRDAVRISQALFQARDMVAAGETDTAKIKRAVRDYITQSPLARIDYIETVSTQTLEPAGAAGPGTLLAAAVFFGATRLIDNIIIEG